MATYAGSPQIAVRLRGSNKCSTHHGKEVVCYCQNCDKLACADCAIQECQGHKFERISNVVPTAKQKLQDFITKAEITEIPSIQERIQAADNDLAKNTDHFKNQIRKIRKQNEALKEELDKITETFVNTYQGMEQQNLDELLNYKRHIQTRIDKLASQIQDAKRTLQSGNDILVFDILHEIQSKFDYLPQTPICSTPEFIPGKYSVQVLEELLGKLNINVRNQLSNLPGKWNVKSTFTPYKGYIVRAIHATAAGDQTWLSFHNFNAKNAVEKMLLTDQSGQVKQVLDMVVRVQDFCLSPNTGNIWYCSSQDNNVREVKAGKSTVRFRTTVQQCICLSREDHVIIGHHRQVVKYTQDGQVICRTPDRNQPVVRSPFRLSQCPLTSNLAVMDWDRKEEGGNDKKHVCILNDQLQLLHNYTGEVQGEQLLKKTFCPYDVCYTQTGELVITDFNNMTLMLVTGTGRYIKTLYTKRTSGPQAVSVHRGALWVSLDDETVRVLKNS